MLLITNGTIVDPVQGIYKGDILIRDGKIAKIADKIEQTELKEETESVYVPVENKENVEVGEYYNYPGCHITITDLREKEITIKGRVCTSRGMDGKNDM